jgi:hypothetical protein
MGLELFDDLKMKKFENYYQLIDYIQCNRIVMNFIINTEQGINQQLYYLWSLHSTKTLILPL